MSKHTNRLGALILAASFVVATLSVLAVVRSRSSDIDTNVPTAEEITDSIVESGLSPEQLVQLGPPDSSVWRMRSAHMRMLHAAERWWETEPERKILLRGWTIEFVAWNAEIPSNAFVLLEHVGYRWPVLDPEWGPSTSLLPKAYSFAARLVAVP